MGSSIDWYKSWKCITRVFGGILECPSVSSNIYFNNWLPRWQKNTHTTVNQSTQSSVWPCVYGEFVYIGIHFNECCKKINEALLKTSICLFQFSKHWGLVPHYCVQLSTWCVNCGFDSEWDLRCIVALPQRWTFASAYWRDVEEYSQEVPWKMEFP